MGILLFELKITVGESVTTYLLRCIMFRFWGYKETKYVDENHRVLHNVYFEHECVEIIRNPRTFVKLN